MASPSKFEPNSRFLKWFESRLPVFGLLHSSFVVFPTPRNLNYWWTFGAVLFMFLVLQILTGLVVSMHYTANANLAFDSIEALMRDVNYGWMLRYMHAVGASMFFFAVYLHIFRGFYYGSYVAPREILWILGVIIYILMMATGFLGYVLVWGQMSYPAANVITNLITAIPLVGEPIVEWVWGGYSVDNPTLNRFYSLHFLLPFVIAGIAILHVWALHVVGSNNPSGVEVKTKNDTLSFHPYFTMKDLYVVVLVLIIFAWFVFFNPNYLGHPDNYVPANPLVTPAHIVPEWYFLPFYAILRAVPDKLLGVILMFGAIVIPALMPWFHTSPVRSTSHRPVYKVFFWIFVAVALLLGWLGSQPAEEPYVTIARVCTVYYFAFFIIVNPLTGWLETPKPVPASITEAVMAKVGRSANKAVANSM